MPPRRRKYEELAHRRVFGDRVAQARHERGWTQEQLAEHSGLHRTYVVRVERGLVNVSIDAIHDLAGGLGVDIADLFEASE